ncbi:MAG TPA: LysR family transcriptional regulator [Desulfitobacteriaceae bacterium]|nr:LysR family transcriptional regulator [Desulfitobacteriaceae bacterium]
MNQRHLEYFLEVFKHQSIKTAAEQLHISPQGISKTILALEEELQEQLFDRSGKFLTPTPAAIILKHHAQKILEEYRLIKNKEYLSPASKTTLKVLSSHDVLQYLTVDFIKGFQAAHPDILPIITETTDKMALQMLHDEDAEIGLLPGPLDDFIFSAEYLYSSRYCAVINQAHPLAQKTVICYEDLHQQPLAVRGREFSLYNAHQRIFAGRGVEPINIIETSSYYIIHRMAEANLCLAVSLDYIAFADPQPHTVTLPFEDDQMIKTVYLAEKRQKTLSPEASRFKRFLFQWLELHRNQLFHWNV